MIKIGKPEREILEQLAAAKEPVFLEDLKCALGLSDRRLKASLLYIHDFLLEKFCADCLELERKTVCLSACAHNGKIQELTRNLSKAEYYLSKQEREEVIYFHFIAGIGKTLDDLSTALDISKTTLKSSLPFVRNMIHSYGLKLENVTKTGLQLTGDERVIRKALLDFLYLNCKMSVSKNGSIEVNLNHLNPYLQDFVGRVIYPDVIEKAVAVLKSLNDNIDIAFENDEVYFIALLILAILYYRTEANNLLPPAVLPAVNEKAAALSKKVAPTVGAAFGLNLNSRELDDFLIILNKGYLSDWLEFNEVQLIGIQIVIHRIISGILSESLSSTVNLSKILNPDLENAFEMLYTHIYKAVARIRSDIRIQNPFLEDVRTNFPELFNLTAGKLIPLEELTGKAFNPDEVAYITLLSENLISHLLRDGERLAVKQIIIICGAGFGTGQIIKNKIEKIFDVQVKSIIPFRQLESAIDDYEVDFFVSTVPIQYKNESIIEVSPLITIADIEKLKAAGIKENTFDLDRLLDIIESSCFVHDRNALVAGLKKMLNIKEVKARKHNILLNYLSEKLVALRQEAATWQEAVRFAGNLLLKNGNIKESYIEAMIKNVDLFGPYITIGRGIALPHAKNEDNVLAPGFSIVTLKEPVVFDNDEKVNVIICFCAKSKDGYEEALLALTELIEYRNLLGLMEAAGTPEEFMRLVTDLEAFQQKIQLI